jgi:hypothetical protein
LNLGIDSSTGFREEKKVSYGERREASSRAVPSSAGLESPGEPRVRKPRHGLWLEKVQIFAANGMLRRERKLQGKRGVRCVGE